MQGFFNKMHEITIKYLRNSKKSCTFARFLCERARYVHIYAH